ncbi:MAG: T9SS type A sorting domain-containing protein [Bacteroidales bacterium]|nr:T9SS type A sorting domain-containing protein [Bacteroidales bacterium]
MRKYILLLVVFVACTGVTAVAQNISVQNATGQSIENFINQQLIGKGVHIYNVKFQNASGNIGTPQIGTFRSNGYPKLQMDSGVVMTTGNISVAPGPNNSGSQSASVSGYYSDNIMASYASSSINGCSTVDFDFVSMSPFVTMNYCFGSEEYPEYVWSTYNDVFAFIVTGPDPNSGGTMTKNIAIIPHTVTSTRPNGITVAINSVNNHTGTESPSQGYYNSYSDFYVQNHTNGNDGGPNQQPGVQYDGFTQKLSANATLLPCQQYHMHISICNVGDNSWDSGVFLEKKSFNSPSASVDFSHRYADTIERSRPEIVPFTLNGTDYSTGTVNVSFGGTAVVGTDYTIVTDSNHTIDNNHRIFRIDDQPHYLKISGTPNANLTQPKSINLYLATSLCSAYPDLKTYDTIRYILAEDDIVRLKDTTITAYDTCREVGVEMIIGQHPPYTYHWMPETDIDFPYQQYSTAVITESSDYRVAVADSRGHVDTADVSIEILHVSGIDNQPQAQSMSIYPNPASDFMHVEAQGLIRLELISADGAVVYSRNCRGWRQMIDTTPYAKGIYTLRVTTTNWTETKKIIIN